MRQSFANLQVARNRGEVSGRAVTQGRAELRAAEQGLNQLRQQYSTAQADAESLNSALRRQTSELNQLRSAFQSAGVGADNLASHERNLQSDIDRATQQLQRQQNIDSARGRVSQASFDVSNAYSNFQGATDTARSIMSPFTEAVKTYANFDATMSKVKAITGATGADFEKLTAQARELGATTQFSASESAEAMTFLGMAGFSTEQILGAMPGMLQLAAAGGTDLATTADIVSDGMTAMGLTAGEKIPNAFGKMVDSTTHFADVMAATSSGANTNVQMMGETFKYAASVAGSLGYSIDDVALATGLMANAGIKGSMAGTALRSIMTRMAKPTKESQAAMDKLGLSITDSSGKMKPFKQIMDDMREGFAKLTPAEQAETAAMLAGQEAMSGALAIATASAKDYNTLAESIAKSDGAAKAMSDTMTDNLQGSLKALESASESVQISLGKMFEPAARSAATFATQAAQSLDSFIQKNPEVAAAAGTLAAAFATVTVGLAGFGLASSAFTYLSAQFDFLKLKVADAAARIREFWLANTAGSSSSAAVNAIRNLGSAFAGAARSAMAFVFSPVGAAMMALAVAGYLVYQNWDRLGPLFSNIAGILGGTLSSSISAIAPAVRTLGANFQLLMSTLQSSGTLDALSSTFSNLASTVGGYLVQAFIIFANVAVGAVSAVTGVFAGIVSTVANAATLIIGIVRNVIEGNWAAAWQKAKDLVVQTFSGIADIILAPFKAVGDTIGNIMKSLDIFHISQEMPTAAAMNRHRQDAAPVNTSADHVAQSTANIDTSQTQAQIDALGQSSQAAAESQNQVAQNLQTQAETTSQFQQTLSEVGNGVTNFSQNITSVGEGTTALQQNLTATGESFTQVTTNAQTTSTEFTNLTAATQQVTPALQQVTQSATSTAPPLQQVGSSASSASSGLSQISSAAGSVASALQSKAAQISSISISAPKVASNASGGIYKKGAFLTTFAEKSPEAAIPLDNSARAKDLWTKAGQALGTLPGTPPTPQSPAKLTPAEQKILQQAAQDWQTKGTANLPAPTETSSAEYRRRYENNQKLQEAIKFLPVPQTQTVPQPAQTTAQKSTSIFSRRRQTSTQTTPRENFPPFTQTLPRQKNLPLPTNNFNLPAIDKIFSGSVKLPQLSTKLPDVLKNDSNVEGILGGLLSDFDNSFLSNKNASNNVLTPQPPITINITINGNADKEVMQQAGNEIAINLRREMDDWWRDRSFEEERRSFV